MKNPDFVGVGFPKCGTSFFFKALSSHPEIYNNKFGKEIHFFSKPMSTYEDDDGSKYRSLFIDRSEGITGEYSPGILYYPNSIKKLKMASPNSKIIVMVRNPIDRCFSHFKHMKKNRVKNISAKNEKLLISNSIYPESVYSGLYHFSLSQLFMYFPKDQVLILQYEKFCQQFQNEMDKVCRFLEIKTHTFNQTIKQPDSYIHLDHLREDLIEFYEDDVRKFFIDFGKINELSAIDKSLWHDFL